MSVPFQAVRIFILCITVLSLSCDLATGELRENNSIWLCGYKVIFLVAAVKSLTSYVCLKRNTLLERTKQLQCTAVSTTSRGEVLALYREERRVRADNANDPYIQASERGKPILFNRYDRYRPAPVFWCTLTSCLLLFNTAHLALLPLEYASPLFFGAPAFFIYWLTMRTCQLMFI